jgi:hypothetical protein
MMTIDVNNGELDITLSGWDRVWTLKQHLSIPLTHVKSVQVQSPPRMNWKNLRAPGTWWPGTIRAGSYWSWKTHEWSFWNVRKGQRAVVIDLKGEKYARLVLEVEDPDEVMKRVRKAI